MVFLECKKVLYFIKSNCEDSKHPPKYLQDFAGGGDFDLIGNTVLSIFEKYIGLKHDLIFHILTVVLANLQFL